MAISLFIAYLAFTLFTLYQKQKAIVWEVGSAVYLVGAVFVVGMPWYLALAIFAVILSSVAVIRSQTLRELIAHSLYKYAEKSLPKLSETEEEALNAGDVWLEKDIFIGEPDFTKLKNITTSLSDEEKSFLKNETQQLCAMVDEWQVTQTHDFPESVWEFMKEKGFFGLVIDKKYGGKGFSARAHSEIVTKIASRSSTAAVSVMVPNSLGPGELLQHYGTKEQKEHYLPRLADGREIPCFALTEPEAGSDATSLRSNAIVVTRKINNKEVLGLEINLNKRWITLAPIATLIGLAVNLKDPNGLLKGNGREGITCILIPRDTENLEIGNRHLPGNQPFMNGTIRGQNIFVPIDTIIGGQAKAGAGWQMLVECLSIGRSISLPALGCASASVSYLTTGAFAKVRRQFNVEIAQFEGIVEKLAEIGGLAYIVNATRLLTIAAVDNKIKPSVASAITKYFNTENARIAVNNAMDVHAGRAVVAGPRNYLAAFYTGIPISVTVEGANIMSRNLLIFGQGSIACHPYLREEFYALKAKDPQKFSNLLWDHINYFLTNSARAISSAFTAGFLISAPKNKLNRQYQKLTRLSYAYATIADLALITLGGELKRKERLSARLADAMSYLYMAMASLKFYDDNNHTKAHEVHAKWATDYCFYHAQKAMIEFCQNFPVKVIGTMIRSFVFPLGQTMKKPSDKADQNIASQMLTNNEVRDNFLELIFTSGDIDEPVDKMEAAFQAVLENAELYKKVKSLRRLKFGPFKAKLGELVENGTITAKERDALAHTEDLRWDAIQVDEFAQEDMKNKTFEPVDQTKLYKTQNKQKNEQESEHA